MNTKSENKDSQELAVERTDWAEDRTILANERTFAGWMRTGMASVALALGLKAVFGDFEPTWLAKAAATVFIVAALYIFWMARRKSCQTLQRLEEKDAKPVSTRTMTITTGLLAFGAVATGAILWTL